MLCELIYHYNLFTTVNHTQCAVPCALCAVMYLQLMATGDYDGDLYIVIKNQEVVSRYRDYKPPPKAAAPPQQQLQHAGALNIADGITTASAIVGAGPPKLDTLNVEPDFKVCHLLILSKCDTL